MKTERISAKRKSWINILAAAIAVMFFYAAFSKLIDYEASKRAMLNQVFPKSIGEIFTWLIPAIEIVLVFLLVYIPTRLKALWASLVLLSLFTLYIAIVMTGVFGRVPCSCGGILKNMKYGTHILFNLFFMFLAFIGIWLETGWKLNNSMFHFKKRKERSRQLK